MTDTRTPELLQLLRSIKCPNGDQRHKSAKGATAAIFRTRMANGGGRYEAYYCKEHNLWHIRPALRAGKPGRRRKQRAA